MSIRIQLTDDHTLVRKALAELIEANDGYQVVAQAGDGEELLAWLRVTGSLPDLVLLDINMPRMDGFATMEQLHQEFPDLPVLVLSMNDDEASIIRMMKLGAAGYMSKQIRDDELIRAIDTVVKQGYYYTNEVTSLVMNQMKQKSTEPLKLSEREKELLSYIGTELTYKEIADRMHLSPKTVDGYREDLFQKLQIRSRVGLAVYAIKQGYYKP